MLSKDEGEMLEAINEVKKALGKMEKCYKKVKNSRDIAGRDEADKETYWHGGSALRVEGVEEAQKEAQKEPEKDLEKKGEKGKEAAEEEAPAKDSESDSDSEDESRKNTEEWTSNMPAVYSD